MIARETLVAWTLFTSLAVLPFVGWAIDAHDYGWAIALGLLHRALFEVWYQA